MISLLRSLAGALDAFGFTLRFLAHAVISSTVTTPMKLPASDGVAAASRRRAMGIDRCRAMGRRLIEVLYFVNRPSRETMAPDSRLQAILVMICSRGPGPILALCRDQRPMPPWRCLRDAGFAISLLALIALLFLRQDAAVSSNYRPTATSFSTGDYLAFAGSLSRLQGAVAYSPQVSKISFQTHWLACRFAFSRGGRNSSARFRVLCLCLCFYAYSRQDAWFAIAISPTSSPRQICVDSTENSRRRRSPVTAWSPPGLGT